MKARLPEGVQMKRGDMMRQLQQIALEICAEGCRHLSAE